MPNDNERLTRFEKAVFSEVETKTAEILSEVDTYREEKLDGVQEAELQLAYQRIQRKSDDIRSEFAMLVTKEKLAAKQQLLLRRKHLADNLCAKAQEYLAEFSNTPDYDAFLNRLLTQQKDFLAAGALVQARPADVERVKKLAPNLPVEANPAIHTGGLLFICEAAQMYLDETFETKLDEAMEQFYTSGKADLSAVEGAEAIE